MSKKAVVSGAVFVVFVVYCSDNNASFSDFLTYYTGTPKYKFWTYNMHFVFISPLSFFSFFSHFFFAMRTGIVWWGMLTSPQPRNVHPRLRRYVDLHTYLRTRRNNIMIPYS